MAGAEFTATGVYVAVTDIVSAAAQTEITAAFTVLNNLIALQTATANNPNAEPNFNLMHPALAKQLTAEMTALRAAITAAPTS